MLLQLGQIIERVGAAQLRRVDKAHQMRSADETWYQGTADAIFQNILIEQADPHLVAIFGADHIYRMNIASMMEYHEKKSARG